MRNIKISGGKIGGGELLGDWTRSQERTEEAGKPGEEGVSRRREDSGGLSATDRLNWEEEREATDVKLQQEVCGDFLHVGGKEQRWLF